MSPIATFICLVHDTYKGHHEKAKSGLHLDPYFIKIQHVEMDSELVAQRSRHPASRSQHLDANTIGIFIPILQIGAITQYIRI